MIKFVNSFLFTCFENVGITYRANFWVEIPRWKCVHLNSNFRNRLAAIIVSRLLTMPPLLDSKNGRDTNTELIYRDFYHFEPIY